MSFYVKRKKEKILFSHKIKFRISCITDGTDKIVFIG